MDNNDDKDKKDGGSTDIALFILALLLIGVVFFVFSMSEDAPTSGDLIPPKKENGITEKPKEVKAVIKGTEAVGEPVHYNTFFELSDGSILKVRNENIYAYAKYNEADAVTLKIVEGEYKYYDYEGKEKKDSDSVRYVEEMKTSKGIKIK